MSAGRPRAAAGASARKSHRPGCAGARPTGGQPLVGVEPWKDRSKQRQTCGTGSARLPRRNALCSFESTPHPGSLSCEFPSCRRNPLSRKGSEQSSNGPDKKSREIRLTWERVGRILRRGVRPSRPEEGADLDGTPNEQADVAPGARPRAARHRADRWHLLVRQSGPPGPGGILVSGDSPVAVFEEPPPRGGSFPFPAPVSDQYQERSFR